MDEQLFHKFLNWERATRDTIDFKKIYVDMAGDHLAGLVLSEIVFWHLPNGQGESKLRIRRDDNDWIACTRYEWWDRTRLTPRQIDRIIKQLVKINLVYKKTCHFAGAPTLHVRINWEAFFALWDSLVAAPLENPYAPKTVSHQTVKKAEYAKSSAISPNGKLPNGEIHITENVKTYTEDTNRDKEKDSAPEKSAVTESVQIAEVPKAAKPTTSHSQQRHQNPTFNAVRQHVFLIDDPNAQGGRIAKISNWLDGTYEGQGKEKVGKISSPATVEHIEAFGRYCKAKGITPPRDFVKFVEMWRTWASQTAKTKTQTNAIWQPLVPEEKPKETLTPEQRAALVAEAKNGRQAALKKMSLRESDAA